MIEQVNWDIAPQDATHHGHVNNKDVIAWYKYEVTLGGMAKWSYWYSDNGILTSTGWCALPAGGIPMQLPLTPRPGFIAPPFKKEWIPGETLPPVGEIVTLVTDTLAEHSSLYKVDSFAGDDVEILAHFVADNGVDVAVFICKGNGGKFVKQGIAKLFKKLDTPEEKTARKRESDLTKLHNEFAVAESQQQLINSLYDNGRLTV